MKQENPHTTQTYTNMHSTSDNTKNNNQCTITQAHATCVNQKTTKHNQRHKNDSTHRERKRKRVNIQQHGKTQIRNSQKTTTTNNNNLRKIQQK